MDPHELIRLYNETKLTKIDEWGMDFEREFESLLKLINTFHVDITEKSYEEVMDEISIHVASIFEDAEKFLKRR